MRQRILEGPRFVKCSVAGLEYRLTGLTPQHRLFQAGAVNWMSSGGCQGQWGKAVIAAVPHTELYQSRHTRGRYSHALGVQGVAVSDASVGVRDGVGVRLGRGVLDGVSDGVTLGVFDAAGVGLASARQPTSALYTNPASAWSRSGPRFSLPPTEARIA